MAKTAIVDGGTRQVIVEEEPEATIEGDGSGTPLPPAYDTGDGANPEPISVNDYGANGEAATFPVVEPAPGQQPLREDLVLRQSEMHDGKEVTEHQARFGGKAMVGRSAEEQRAFWESLRYGRKGECTVRYEVSGDGHAPVKDRDGDVVGLVAFRKLRITSLNIGERTLEDEVRDDELASIRAEAKEWLAQIEARTSEDQSGEILADLCDWLEQVVGEQDVGTPAGTADDSDLPDAFQPTEPSNTLGAAMAEATRE